MLLRRADKEANQRGLKSIESECEGCVQIGMDKPVLLLDSDGSVAPKAAKELAAASTERPSVIFVNGGAAAWQAAELPWKQPLRLGFNFDSLKNLAGGGGSGGTAASGAFCYLIRALQLVKDTQNDSCVLTLL